uniref:t-SNARE coiled-coil homology domain-containing protein n=1 Tax=Minutocellus polymorphus TaxID=265543 RepID=A0A6U4EPX2_9STRA|mmetsp:Transcript_4206/g.7200  ORF Transcript_4206/g.7200 Transcript_4206/m.7200 type:complete len:256 (+) Transcript_4206:35-802(+)|eukprot:CAMPEP_0181046990 /NCGR_PEP_ID=MMETSP1070-20121207/14639_1 /TAXON_ID=265543 /ORGANISM="Minutocellus polymorphus, Strain NH13" /LENGTH=255 /DNA_ID=CAMNT_0023125629 /DNA_START=6 /DNA_END=773 /DNA_ORIENTATION=+
MNDEERKVVAETARMEEATSDCLHDIERKLEETTSVAHVTEAELKQNTKRMHKVQDAADALLSSSKATHKLMNRLRRWGASDRVGNRTTSTKKKTSVGGGTAADDEVLVERDSSKIERLLHDLDVTKEATRKEVEDQRESVKRLEVAADSVAGIASAAASKRRSSAASSTNSSSAAARISETNNTCTARSEEKSNKHDDAALDRIGNLLDGLQDQAKEYTGILEAQSQDLDKIDNALESANQSMRQADRRLKKSR